MMKMAMGAGAVLLLLAGCGPKDETSFAVETGAAASEAAATTTAQASAGAEDASTDALVPGTEFNATAQVPCGFKQQKPEASCPAGVKRQWGEDGTTLVEVTKPDGMKRALFFKDGKAYGADSAQSDGSAGWDFRMSREGDASVIVFGPETYIVPDAFVSGG